MRKVVIVILILCYGCEHGLNDKITFPYSQWTIGRAGNNISWEYDFNLKRNESFISVPGDTNWQEWHRLILEYRNLVRKKIGKEEPILHCIFPSDNPAKIHFDKFGYDLAIYPGEKISIKGSIKNSGDVTIYFDFDLKSKGEELSYVVRKKLISRDSVQLNRVEDWTSFSKEITVPHFSADSFSITPVLRLDSKHDCNVYLKEIRLSIAPTDKRKKLLARIENFLNQQNGSSKLKLPEELSWSNQNFVMGFVFMWDQNFWNPLTQEYTVDTYCDKMENEFGGFQSIILWHSYPNIGIDEKNQFDFLYQMPGGLDGIKKVVSDFHKRNVKVFITYNPWDLDTRRPMNPDSKELAKIVHYTDADGIFLDTWNSAAGNISIFSVENFIREEVGKYHRNVAFISEILPEFKDLTGKNALTSSWGQEIEPFHYVDLSHQKWIMPEHKQYFIKRMENNRKRLLAHAWINGQGILVWENIFGTMNLWDAKDRQALRKMNAIWKSYGNVYLSDKWLPFVPTGIPGLYASKWITKDVSIWNIVDSSNVMKNFKIEAERGKHYYDLWTGKELAKKVESGTTFVEVSVQNFSCILEANKQDDKLIRLLAIQKAEEGKRIPSLEEDTYRSELSLKLPIKYQNKSPLSSNFHTDFIKICGGTFEFQCKHIYREGGCYPDMDAMNNHVYSTIIEDNALWILHKHTEPLQDFLIMPRVVTNGEFEQFLEATNYHPRNTENFLKHWNGKVCPDKIANQPVVYVSLEDARAFAEWAGMQLPTEWEWQRAAEYSGDKFVFNEVFEWNESERNDGFNRFVNLRGGCSRWTLPSSWWYLPGAPYARIAGGKQRYNSHVKYFLMYPGLDRASTIGFRCVKPKFVN